MFEIPSRIVLQISEPAGRVVVSLTVFANAKKPSAEPSFTGSISIG